MRDVALTSRNYAGKPLHDMIDFVCCVIVVYMRTRDISFKHEHFIMKSEIYFVAFFLLRIDLLSYLINNFPKKMC